MEKYHNREDLQLLSTVVRVRQNDASNARNIAADIPIPIQQKTKPIQMPQKSVPIESPERIEFKKEPVAVVDVFDNTNLLDSPSDFARRISTKLKIKKLIKEGFKQHQIDQDFI